MVHALLIPTDSLLHRLLTQWTMGSNFDCHTSPFPSKRLLE